MKNLAMKIVPSSSVFAAATMALVSAAITANAAAEHNAVQFELDLARTPLELGVPPPPNLLIVNDDSSSMDWDILTDQPQGMFHFSTGASVRYVLPMTAGQGAAAADETSAPGEGLWALRNAAFNGVYYNPAINYEPWKGLLDGAPFPDATPTAARHNPASSSPATNLRAPVSYIGSGAAADGQPCPVETQQCPGGVSAANVTVRNYYIPRHYAWNDRDGDGVIDLLPSPAADPANSEGSLIEIKPAAEGGSDTYPRHPDRTDCVAMQGACTFGEEMQNFANWFTYHRSRAHAAKSALGQVVAAAKNIRIGYAKLNSASNVARISLMNPSARTGARAALLDAIHATGSSGGTPLRRALRDAGRHFECASSDIFGSGAATSPGEAGCPVLAAPHGNCQRNFTLLVSDGAWNGAAPGVGDDDGDNNTNFDGGAFAGPARETLADVAMRYYERDLHPGLANEVRTSPRDRASAAADAFQRGGDDLMHQHMATFTMGFGVAGLIGDRNLPRDHRQPFDWGDPDTAAGKIDDMRHAAVNGRGRHFSATSGKGLADALAGAFAEFAVGAGAASAVSFTTQEVREGTLLLRAFYDTRTNTGNLVAIPFTAAGLADVPAWEAAEQLDSKTHGSREIITMHPGDPGPARPRGIPFRPGSLAPAQRDIFISDPDASEAERNAEVARGVNYLRGDASNERPGGDLRARPANAGRLGDIVHSRPIFVGPPDRRGRDIASFPSGADSYDTFRGAHAGDSSASPPVPPRRSMVYVSANDGMMHGFDAATGEEVFAYLPNALMQNNSQSSVADLLHPDYRHRFLLDGTPAINDVFTDPDGPGGASRQWVTMLVGGHGAGAKSYFALNVTDPARFTEATADEVVMWEFTERDDAYSTAGNGANRTPLTLNGDGVTRLTDLRSPPRPVKDLGYTFTSPTLAMMNVQEGGEGKWAALAGNGYNSTAGVAKLFIIWLDGPSGDEGQWCHPDMRHNKAINGAVPDYCAGRQDYVKLDTGFGVIDDPGEPLHGFPNGLGAPRAIDADGNGTADYIYAGDYHGNLFRFDVTSGDPDDWSVHRLHQASYEPDGGHRTGNKTPQPITTQPVVVRHPSQGDGFMVIFATGSFIAVGDGRREDIQSIYGLWDRLDHEFIQRSQLVRNRWVNAAPAGAFGEKRVRTLKGPSAHGEAALDYSADRGHRGWRIDLDMVAPGGVEGLDRPEFPGERAIRRLQARGGGIFAGTVFMDSRGVCVPRAGGALLAFCPEDGLDRCFDNSAFDIDNDGDFDEVAEGGGKITGLLIQSDAAPSESGFIGNRLVTQIGDELLVMATGAAPAANVGRLSWKRLQAPAN